MTAHGMYNRYWTTGVLTSKMDKVKRFLKEISVARSYPRSIFQSTKISEGQFSPEESLFTSAYGGFVDEPFVVFEYFVRDALRSEEKLLPTQAVEQSLEMMEELFSSRKPGKMAGQVSNHQNSRKACVRDFGNSVAANPALS